MKDQKSVTILVLSLIICVLAIITSFVGLFSNDIYASESLNWQAQSVGQDLVDLIVVIPFFAATSILTFNGKIIASYLWAGSLMYLIYTFIIYCFSLHFNVLFLFYCIILGLSFYLFLYFLYSRLRKTSHEFTDSISFKVTAIYFILIGTVFYLLWLSEIIPALINNVIPANLLETGLFTNPVHVLDLSVVLPGIIITGILILRKHPIGYSVAPILLTFFILMNITIAALIVVMKSKGLEANLALTFVMGFLALISVMLLISLKKGLKN